MNDILGYAVGGVIGVVIGLLLLLGSVAGLLALKRLRPLMELQKSLLDEHKKEAGDDTGS